MGDEADKQFKVDLAEQLHRAVDEYRVARGVPMGQVLAQAIERYLKLREAEPWSGYGLHKPAGAPWPPKPPTASNRRGGPGEATTPPKSSTARLSASLWGRWVAYLYWTRAHNRLESEEAARAWLREQGVNIDEL